MCIQIIGTVHKKERKNETDINKKGNKKREERDLPTTTIISGIAGSIRVIISWSRSRNSVAKCVIARERESEKVIIILTNYHDKRTIELFF
mmetsp:Transcript_7255/g.7107  ORF Transcript_7255/g.7107 Transcript_7255/m.7107 type:complete len:91 (-) Transcript_7255:42-314(-)